MPALGEGRKNSAHEPDSNVRLLDELHLISDALPVLISLIDREGIYRFANRYYETWFGVLPDGVVGRHVRDVLGDEAYVSRRPFIERALAGEEVVFDAPMPHRDGRPRISEMRYIPRRGASGSVDGFLVMVTDLSERQRQAAFRAALVELGDRFGDIDDPAGMAFVAAEILGRTLDLDRAGYGTVDTAIEYVEIEQDWTGEGIASIAGRHRFADYGAIAADLAQGREVIIPDVTRDPRTSVSASSLLALGVRALLNVPVMEHGRVVAVFFLHDREIREWRSDKLAFIRDVAERTRQAIERLRAEASRRASEDQFRVFAQAMPNHVWASRPDGLLDWFNEQVYAYSGSSHGELDGTEWARIVHPDDQPAAAELWCQSLSNGTVYETEFRIRRADDAYRWFLVRAVPIRDDTGALVRWIGTNTDIHDQKSSQAELARLNAHLETEVQERTNERNRLWQTTNDLMGTAGLDGYLKTVNPAWTQMLGWEAGELLSRPFLDIIDPADHAETYEVVARLARGEVITGFVDRVFTKDGNHRTIMWTAVPEPGADLFYIVGRDLTEQHRVEEQLRQSQKMEAVGQLTGGIAHDFNNLLTGISGSLELLQSRMGQGRLNDLDRYINAAQGASKRAAALTHRLLAFSRQQTLDPKPTNVNALVHGMEELIRRTVGPAVYVEVVGAAGLWAALVDPHQLENALLNLCINARDAMPDGGRITIETANKWLDERAAADRDMVPGQYLSLCVTDTGTGMTPGVVAKAFDPFFTTKPIGQGTGLGLSMIHGFARQSGGQVRIYTELGQGTTMCLYFPRYYGEAEEGDSIASLREAQRAQQGQTVLVVDDEPTVRMLVTEVLEDLGYIAIEATDGPSGLKVLQSDVRLDLLVTDVGLPGGMNGRQMADAGRAWRPDLKVLFITGFAENAVVGNGHLDPGMQVLTKPFVMEVLANRIRELIAAN